MEGIQTIQALKAVQSSLPAQTTIPSDELVMLYAADGTPIAKIARDDLVKAVASVMASNSQNTFSKLLGVQANGTPMGIGASDLASVLGVYLGYYVHYQGTLGPGESTPQLSRYGLVVIIERSTRGGCALATFSLNEQKVISDPISIINDYYTISQGNTTGTMIITNKDSANHMTHVILITY